MSRNLRLLRFYYVLLAVFTVGRWSLGFAGVPYEHAHQVFSLVILTYIGAAHHAAFARRYLDYRLGASVGLGATMGLITQIVIWLSTVISYGAGIHSYFNYPTALNVTSEVAFGPAMVIRAQGLVANVIGASIAAALGYLMGAALPKRETLA